MRSRILAVLTSILFAAALWVAVILGAETQLTARLPLRIDFPTERAPLSLVPEHITATFHGPGWRIAQYLLLASPRCTVDLTTSKSASTVALTRRLVLQSLQLPPQVSIVDIEPDSLLIALEQRVERTVPVNPQVNIATQHGFDVVSTASADPDSITVSGAASIVANIESYPTAMLKVRGAVAPIRTDVPLDDPDGSLVSLSRSNVAVRADVQEIAERTFTNIPVKASHGGVHLVPATVSVLVRGGVETLAAMSPADISASVGNATLFDGSEASARVEVHVPSHLSVLRTEPARVDWYLRQTR